jgi:hypothetical protein
MLLMNWNRLTRKIIIEGEHFNLIVKVSNSIHNH